MIELNSDDFAIFLRLGILFFEEILSNILECSSWTVNDIFDFKTFWADWAKMVGHGWAKVWKYLMSYILVQKSVWRRSESRVGLASKRQVWSILFLFESGHNLPFDTWSYLKFDGKFRRDIKWSKLAFSKQVQHVILNSFKHFSGPKYKT